MAASPNTVGQLGLLQGGLTVFNTAMQVSSMRLASQQARNEGTAYAVQQEQERTRLSEMQGQRQAQRLNLLQQQNEAVRQTAQVLSGNTTDAVRSGLDVTSGSVRQVQRALQRRSNIGQMVAQSSLADVDALEHTLERRRYITRVAERATRQGVNANRWMLRSNAIVAGLGGATNLIAHARDMYRTDSLLRTGANDGT